MRGPYHDGHFGHSNENVKNQRRTVKIKKSPNSRRIHGHTIFRKQVCGRHRRTPEGICGCDRVRFTSFLVSAYRGIYTSYRNKILLQRQWRTEEGVRGLEPLPLAYGLRNKRVRMHQKRHFQQTIRKIFWGGAQPPPQTLPPVGREISSPHTPTPLAACGTSTPPILKFWVRHCAALYNN